MNGGWSFKTVVGSQRLNVARRSQLNPPPPPTSLVVDVWRLIVDILLMIEG